MASIHPVVWFEVLGRDADEQRSIGGAIGPAAPAQPSWVTFYTQVEDLGATTAKGLGSTVLMSPTRLTETTIAVVSDPRGPARRDLRLGPKEGGRTCVAPIACSS
jgi:hypothetical protein